MADVPENEQEGVVDEAALDVEGEAQTEESAPSETSIESLQAELGAAQTKASEHYDGMLRLQAEMDNLRKRTERDVENAHKFALEKFVNELLPVKDSLDMGLAAAQQEANLDKLIEGVELTLKQFNQAMDKFAVVEVNPEGEKFDPELHQAMSMQPSADHEPNTVMAVMQKGYTLNGRLIRPAMVMVAKAP